MRVSLAATQGFDFRGGHPEEHGLTPEGVVVDVPLHRHEVSLDLTQVELELAWAWSAASEARLRLPFAVKDQAVDIRPVDPATAGEIEAMLANGWIHHRDGAYTGVQDAALLVARRWSGVVRPGDRLSLALGASIPVGKTEANPYALGDAGREHLHLQFGTGTFDPLLEASWGTAIGRNVSVGGFAQGRASLYENGEGFRGAPELHAGVTAARRVGAALEVRAGYHYYRQGFAHWAGERDENTGLASHYAGFGAAFPVSSGFRLEIDARWPFAQTVFDEESDAFDQGPTLRAGLVGRIR